MEEVFLPRVEFDSYGDFFNNYRVNVPEPFNFAYDVMDVLAAKSPDARALVWTNDEGCFCEFSYGELKRRTDAAASFFRAQGIGRGDMVMLILQRRYEFWISILALHKLGASVIPATHMLTREDIEYRNNAAGIKAVVAVADGDILRHVDGSLPVSPALKVRIAVNPHGIDVPFGQACVSPDGTEHPAVDLPSGWLDFTAGAAAAAPFTPPPRAEVNANHDIMLAYFTSGTTSHPKLVAHDFTYPLGHIVTAKYWQRVRKGGLHLTVADTGWGKAVWGKLYGQFICECAVFVYDYHARFKPIDSQNRRIPDHIVLCAADHLPLSDSGRSFRVRPFFAGTLLHCGRAAFGRGVQPVEKTHRAGTERRIRADGNGAFPVQFRGRKSEARVDRQTRAVLQLRAAE